MATTTYTNQTPAAVVTVSDVEIGAVELKNSTTDDRAVVQTASSADASDIALTVADGNVHDSLGAVGAAADVDGVIHGQLRYIGESVDGLEADIAKLEARIAQPLLTAAPASISVDTSTARTTGLTVGTPYMVYATVPCWIKVGNDTVEAANTDVYIEPGDRFVWTPSADNTDDGVACIASVAGGKVYVQACQA